VADRLSVDLPKASELRRQDVAARSDGAEPTGEIDATSVEAVNAVVRAGWEQLGKEISLCLRYYAVTFRGHRPDVVMLGDIRDPETARTAVQAALTGHLVLSTLHTNDSPSAVTRLHNLHVESYLVSASLVAILAQRLVRRICPQCRRQVEPSPVVLHSVERLGITTGETPVPQRETPVPQRFFEGRGCSQCNQVGMKGRVGIYELLVPDDELRDAIASDAPLGAMIANASMSMSGHIHSGTCSNRVWSQAKARGNSPYAYMPAHLDAFPPVAPGKMLAIPKDDPALRALATPAG